VVSRARYRLAESATRMNARLVVVARAFDLDSFLLRSAIRPRRLISPLSHLCERNRLVDDD
jgi:hypothetical protein